MKRTLGKKTTILNQTPFFRYSQKRIIFLPFCALFKVVSLWQCDPHRFPTEERSLNRVKFQAQIHWLGPSPRPSSMQLRRWAAQTDLISNHHQALLQHRTDYSSTWKQNQLKCMKWAQVDRHPKSQTTNSISEFLLGVFNLIQEFNFCFCKLWNKKCQKWVLWCKTARTYRSSCSCFNGSYLPGDRFAPKASWICSPALCLSDSWKVTKQIEVSLCLSPSEDFRAVSRLRWQHKKNIITCAAKDLRTLFEQTMPYLNSAFEGNRESIHHSDPFLESCISRDCFTLDVLPFDRLNTKIRQLFLHCSSWYRRKVNGPQRGSSVRILHPAEQVALLFPVKIRCQRGGLIKECTNPCDVKKIWKAQLCVRSFHPTKLRNWNLEEKSKFTWQGRRLLVLRPELLPRWTHSQHFGLRQQHQRMRPLPHNHLI